MVRVLILCLVLATSLACLMVVPDINGKWKGKMQGPDGDIELVFTFVVKGDSLTGSVQSPMGEIAISNGKFNGDNFSFDISFGEMTMNHQCKILDDSISMKVPGMQGGETEIILKRIEEKK
jgi:hypothetical protein